VQEIKVHLYGSLAHTGKGHGTDKAILLGLEGEEPDLVEIDTIPQKLKAIEENQHLSLNQEHSIRFSPKKDLKFNRKKRLEPYSNAMTFQAFDHQKECLLERTYFSIGGGFILNQADPQEAINGVSLLDQGGLGQLKRDVPYPFKNAKELLNLCTEYGLSISSLMWANESTLSSKEEVDQHLLDIWKVMDACIQRGCTQEGILPGGLRVKRRAPSLYRLLKHQDPQDRAIGMKVLDWVNLWAMAVNEENAAGGRVVTAPTNGAAGIIPAVLSYYLNSFPQADDEGIIRFLLTAGAIGSLYKMNASISGAEVGCQGEVGVACSMAAGALAEVMGGTPAQVENAAEVGMEHNLGLTCDPIGGLVQVPCIERNAMGAIKAINAARLALMGDGSHKVSLDKVIATMRSTGADMSTKYKETARGGLALNMIEC
jgi:L-serine dehydratase